MDKSIVSKVFSTYCRLATIIFMFTSSYIGLMGGAKACVWISYVWGILAISFCMAVGWLPFMEDSTLTKKQMVIGKTIYYTVSVCAASITGYFLQWFTLDNILSIVWFVASIVFVLSVWGILACKEQKRTANKINRKLKELQTED